MNVVSFSGGKDSTCMLLKMIEEGTKIDKIIFVDTTKEFPQMYEHIKKVEEYISPLKIEKIVIPFDYYFSEHIKTKGKRKGQKGYGFPDFRNRWCTSLKRDNVKKVLSGCKDVIQFHGIAFDEQERCEKNQDRTVIKYPLIEWKMTEKDCLEYCYSKGFDWGGLYQKYSRVSCWCCPLQRMEHLRALYNNFPDLWQELKEMEKKSVRRFRMDYTVEELENKFYLENHNGQQELF